MQPAQASSARARLAAPTRRHPCAAMEIMESKATKLARNDSLRAEKGGEEYAYRPHAASPFRRSCAPAPRLLRSSRGARGIETRQGEAPAESPARVWLGRSLALPSGGLPDRVSLPRSG